MKSNNEINSAKLTIEISETGPQDINPEKSHFLFDNNSNKGLPKSPRRDSMPFPFLKSSKSLVIQTPTVKIKEEKIKDPIKERIEQIITENIKNRQGFESLLQDPELNSYINK